MGKNQMHKAQQRTRHAGDAEGGPELGTGEFGVDASFHTAEWHAARIAALTTERMSWEDWKKQQKEEALTAEAMALDEERQMREYRAQLDADRAAKLSKGTNHADLRGALDDAKGKKRKREKEKKSSKGKDKDKDRKKSKKRKEGDKEKKAKKSKRKDSSTDDSSSNGSPLGEANGKNDGPVRLSDFLQGK